MGCGSWIWRSERGLRLTASWEGCGGSTGGRCGGMSGRLWWSPEQAAHGDSKLLLRQGAGALWGSPVRGERLRSLSGSGLMRIPANSM